MLAAFALAPILVLVLDALKSDFEVATKPLGLPSSIQWHNFIDAWRLGGMRLALLNSLLYVAATMVVVSIVSVASAYALVRMRVRFGGPVMAYLLVAAGLPIQSFLVPLFILWTHLHLYDSRLGLEIIFIATSTPFAVLLLRSYLLQVPGDFVEAARVDGAGEFRVARSIVLPLLWPGLVSVALVTGVNVYNDFLFAVTFLQSSGAAPASLSFYSFMQAHGLNYSLLAAGGVIVTAPVFLAFFLLQRRFVEGLAASGLRG